jgi:hypothetical protein
VQMCLLIEISSSFHFTLFFKKKKINNNFDTF